MTSPYHILSGNRFPIQDGKPVLVNKFKYKECCCGTPCFCATIYEWNCDAETWVLTNQAKMCEDDAVFALTPAPDDQWNYFYFKRTFPNREATSIIATYGSWVDTDEECTWPSSPPSAPNEAWRQFKCDASVPTPEPEADGKCQPMALYFYDCEDEEWDLIRVDIVRVRVPEGTEIPDPEDFRSVRVFGKVFDCSEDEPADPPPPKRVTKEQLDCAPRTCPCSGDWPPPCNGLLGLYTVDSFYFHLTSGVMYRLKSAVVLTASPSAKCYWVGNCDIEKKEEDGDWEDYKTNSIITINLSNGLWVLVTAVETFWQFIKPVGQSPMGSYLPNVSFPAGITGSAEVS